MRRYCLHLLQKLSNNGGVDAAEEQMKAKQYAEPFKADKRKVIALASNLPILISIDGGTCITRMFGGASTCFLAILITISGSSRSGREQSMTCCTGAGARFLPILILVNRSSFAESVGCSILLKAKEN